MRARSSATAVSRTAAIRRFPGSNSRSCSAPEHQRFRGGPHGCNRQSPRHVEAERKRQERAGGRRVKSPGHEVKELLGVERSGRRAVAALDFVHLDLELRPRIDLRQRRQQQVAARLARVGAAGARLHDDLAVESTATAAGCDPAIVLYRLGREADVGDLRVQVDLPVPVREEKPVKAAGCRPPFECEPEVRADQSPAEGEQVLRRSGCCPQGARPRSRPGRTPANVRAGEGA